MQKGALIAIGSILAFVFFMTIVGMFLPPMIVYETYEQEKKSDNVLQTRFFNVDRS